MAVERGVGLCNNRPRVRVGGRFAGEVSRIELREGSVDVVGIERDACHDPFVGVDLDDAEYLDVKRLGPLVATRQTVTAEHEAFPADRNDV